MIFDTLKLSKSLRDAEISEIAEVAEVRTEMPQMRSGISQMREEAMTWIVSALAVDLGATAGRFATVFKLFAK